VIENHMVTGPEYEAHVNYEDFELTDEQKCEAAIDEILAFPADNIELLQDILSDHMEDMLDYYEEYMEGL